MDAVRFGRIIRALRHRRAWRQVDLAHRAGVSQSLIARIERGGATRLTVRRLEAIAEELGARVTVRIDWNGEAADRLLDAEHAAIVDAVVALLRAAGWDAVPEATFAVGTERGSIDVLAWHDASATLLVVEVKSVVPDLQSMLAALDRKLRLADGIARARGWRPGRIGSLLVVRDSRTARRRVEDHAATFDARFPIDRRRCGGSSTGRPRPPGLCGVSGSCQPELVRVAVSAWSGGGPPTERAHARGLDAACVNSHAVTAWSRNR